MNDSSDRELRSKFERLRETETADAPDFRSLLDRAARRNGRVERRLTRLAVPIAIAAVVVVAAGVASVVRRRTAVQVPLSSWTSPTAGLLRTPGLGLLGPANILSSALDPAIPASVPRKGTRR